jgi:predicted 2-oxoglutarate/Fe(II)-dependent dioxygenase YbiX
MIIKNFLTKDECDLLLLEAKSSNNWKPQNQDTGIFILKTNNHKMMIEIHKRLSLLFDKNLHTQMIRMIHKTDKDSFWSEHSDNSGGNDIEYGVVIYLNEDFDGGELVYTESDTRIRPEKGLLVCHRGDQKHLVSKVTSGDRYTLTSFIRKPIAKTPGFSV